MSRPMHLGNIILLICLSSCQAKGNSYGDEAVQPLGTSCPLIDCHSGFHCEETTVGQAACVEDQKEDSLSCAGIVCMDNMRCVEENGAPKCVPDSGEGTQTQIGIEDSGYGENIEPETASPRGPAGQPGPLGAIDTEEGK